MPTRVLGVEETDVLASEKAFEVERIPENLLVVGSGAVGLEVASIYNALGSRVTVIDKLTQILPREDAEIVNSLVEMLQQAGVSFQLGTVISKLRVVENGDKVVEISDGGRMRQITAQEVIAAHGRMPNTAGLGLEGIGVELERGAIRTNAKMETNVDGLYAAGDVTGGPMLSHVASAQARVAVDNALGQGGTFSGRVVPRCIYAFPELACVGMTEEEVRANGLEIKVGISGLATNARAATMAKRDGLVKVIADAKSEALLGVHILGPLASEMIAPAVLALNLGCSVGDYGRTYQAHPTLSEALDEAIKAAK